METKSSIVDQSPSHTISHQTLSPNLSPKMSSPKSRKSKISALEENNIRRRSKTKTLPIDSTMMTLDSDIIYLVTKVYKH
jgi:hypothetical protein